MPAMKPWWKPPTQAQRFRYRQRGCCEDCGAGVNGRVLKPHDFGCPTLTAIVHLENAGTCSQCGATKERELAWDDRMHMVLKQHWCPNGHSHERSWYWPEDVTQAERDELGLVAI